jgi:hypothetical protein
MAEAKLKKQATGKTPDALLYRRAPAIQKACLACFKKQAAGKTLDALLHRRAPAIQKACLACFSRLFLAPGFSRWVLSLELGRVERALARLLEMLQQLGR